MSNYYIVGNSVDTTTFTIPEAQYAGYEVRTVDEMQNSPSNGLDNGDNVVVSGTVETDLEFQSDDSASNNFAVNVDLLENANDFDVSIVSHGSGRFTVRADLTVNVKGEAPGVNVGSTDGAATLTVNIDDSAKIGDITGSSYRYSDTANLIAGNDVVIGSFTGARSGDTINSGDDLTIGTINTGDGQDTITLGDNAVINGTISTGSSSDSVTIGSGATFNGANGVSLDTGVGGDSVSIGNDADVNGKILLDPLGGPTNQNDRFSLGDNSTVTGDGSTAIFAGDGRDAITIGKGSLIEGGAILGGDGTDTITIQSNVTLESGSNPPIDTGLGGDKVYLGSGLDSSGDIKFGSTGNQLNQLYIGGAAKPGVDTDIDWSGTNNNTYLAFGTEEAAFREALKPQGYFGSSSSPHMTFDRAIGQQNGGNPERGTWSYNGYSATGTTPLFSQSAVCFANGTLIETDRGLEKVENLREGDKVMTRDNGLQVIRWIGGRKLDAATLERTEKLRPIRIRRHALDVNVPDRDLVVSPQHRVLVRSKIAQRMFGADEVLVAAKNLCLIDGIDVAHDLAEVEYFHFLLDRHEVVISNGAETESLYTGPEALKSVGAAALDEIFAIFPELKDRDYMPVAARPLADGRKVRQLAIRHRENKQPLV